MPIFLVGLFGAALGYYLSCRSNCAVGAYYRNAKGAMNLFGKPSAPGVMGEGPRVVTQSPVTPWKLSLQRQGDVLVYVLDGPVSVRGEVDLRPIIFAVSRRNGVSPSTMGFVPVVLAAVTTLAQNKAVQDAGKKLIKNVAARMKRSRQGDRQARESLRRDMQDPTMRKIVRTVAEHQQEAEAVTGYMRRSPVYYRKRRRVAARVLPPSQVQPGLSGAGGCGCGGACGGAGGCSCSGGSCNCAGCKAA